MFFIGGGDEDTAAGVFGFGAPMETDAGASGDLLEYGQEALELRRLCYREAVNQGGD